MNLLFIPSPPINGLSLGPLRFHFYAMCILAGIAVAWWLSARRWKQRGGKIEALEVIVMWAIPLGIVGARAYHVLTHLADYFGEGRDPWTALYIWQGGLGIMGGIALGAVGAWIGARRMKVPLTTVADVLAPGIAFAQAIGRLGNYFNQELFGLPTTLPWALEIDVAHRPPGYEAYATFHPTFLYEMVWNIAIGVFLLWLDRRFAMGYGKLFVAYAALYALGRLGTEALRIDPAAEILGLRNHQVITGILLLVAVATLVWLFRYRPGRDPDMGSVPRRGTTTSAAAQIRLDSASRFAHTGATDTDGGGTVGTDGGDPSSLANTDPDVSPTGAEMRAERDDGDPA